MAMKFSPALWVYRIAWEPAIVLVEMLAGLEKFSQRNLWPVRWQLKERLGWNWPKTSSTQTIWMHAASLGECKGLWAVAKSLSFSSNADFVLTTNTITGLEFLSKQIASEENPLRWRAVLAPFDHPAIVEKLIECFQVQSLFLYEVELWPHFILTMRKLKSPVFWVSARVNANAQKRYAIFPKARSIVLDSLNWIQTQSEDEAKILRAWKCNSVEVGADLKGLHYLNFIHENLDGNRQEWTRHSGVAFLSLHADELPFVLPAIEKLNRETSVFIFPRKMKELTDFKTALEPLDFIPHSVSAIAPRMLVDSFGLIPDLLSRCHTAVIGGSFTPHGGHNLWEPLAAKVRMIIGPHYENQEYLVTKLSERGLLKISEPLLSEGVLMQPETDFTPAYQDFLAEENRILRHSLEQITEHLEITTSEINKR